MPKSPSKEIERMLDNYRMRRHADAATFGLREEVRDMLHEEVATTFGEAEIEAEGRQSAHQFARTVAWHQGFKDWSRVWIPKLGFGIACFAVLCIAVFTMFENPQKKKVAKTAPDFLNTPEPTQLPPIDKGPLEPEESDHESAKASMAPARTQAASASKSADVAPAALSAPGLAPTPTAPISPAPVPAPAMKKSKQDAHLRLAKPDDGAEAFEPMKKTASQTATPNAAPKPRVRPKPKPTPKLAPLELPVANVRERRLEPGVAPAKELVPVRASAAEKAATPAPAFQQQIVQSTPIPAETPSARRAELNVQANVPAPIVAPASLLPTLAKSGLGANQASELADRDASGGMAPDGSYKYSRSRPGKNESRFASGPSTGRREQARASALKLRPMPAFKSRQVFSQTGSGDFRRDPNSPPASEAMSSFEFHVQNARVTIRDHDGSIYNGMITGRGNLTQTPAAARGRETQLIVDALKRQQVPDSGFSFRVEGVNRTRKQPVIVNGVYMVGNGTSRDRNAIYINGRVAVGARESRTFKAMLKP
ncbi:MAG: hypothetical protein CMO80_14525 [Verrucomicrobiales bacterium]|nr:hypothetical protein [Verrucomicrobiales bacterium]|tara:strand:+ start:7372 stop:8988 length:1617 start_codon:yes stop_codon:yes gene_type:complete